MIADAPYILYTSAGQSCETAPDSGRLAGLLEIDRERLLLRPFCPCLRAAAWGAPKIILEYQGVIGQPTAVRMTGHYPNVKRPAEQQS